MTAYGGHLHLAVNMCWPYAYAYASRRPKKGLPKQSFFNQRVLFLKNSNPDFLCVCEYTS